MTALIRSGISPIRSGNLRLSLLLGQSLSIGITLSMLIITASSLFLPEFGSQGLPYVYIAVAILGSGVFYGYAELLKRWPLPRISFIILGITAVFFFLAWLGLTLTEFNWVSFVLMVAFSLLLQMGFVILGGQAGRLFDVRQLKRLFPRIVAGFVAGFLIGGFITPPLANLLGGTVNVLLAMIIGTLCFLAFVLATDRRYHEALIQAGSARHQQPAKPLGKLLAQRYVVLIVLYQMLAVMGSQLLDFMMYDQAASRFPDSQALTRFFGNLAVALNSTDLIFLILFAGLILSRFGLNLGLLANPAVNGLLLLAELVVIILLGPTSTLFFWLVIVTRIIDITLTDGMRRGSINTTYQALPASDRVAVQTSVEGIAAPIALGLTGVVLLIYSSISGLTILHVVLIALLIVVFWIIFGALTYRDYSEALRRMLRRRALGEAELSLDDGSSLAVVKNLLHSNSLRDVRLALDMLEDAEYESLDSQLVVLAEHLDPRIRVEALNRIEQRLVETALPTVRRLVDEETDPSAKGAALRTLCALMVADAIDIVTPYLTDPNSEVALGAMVGLLHYGGIPGVLAAGERLQSLKLSPDPASRIFTARVIGEVGSNNFYQPLISLLDDEDPQVRRAALDAAVSVSHPRLIPLIINNLAQPGTRSSALPALVAAGEAILPYVEEALENTGDADWKKTTYLVRACGQVPGKKSSELLAGHMGHPDPEVRFQILLALNSSGYSASATEIPAIEARLNEEANDAARILAASKDVGEAEFLELLYRALLDELRQVGQRVFLLLSFLFDARVMLRAEKQLLSGDDSQSALAMEALDVTLSSEQKRIIFPLVDPKLSDAQRAQQLEEIFETSSMTRQERLHDIIINREGISARPWIRACAIYAAGKLNDQQYTDELSSATEDALYSKDNTLRETAIWTLYKLKPERVQVLAAQLTEDPDPQIARLAAELAN